MVQNNVLVSIRMPKTLVKEFREVSKKDHYLDVSEAIRSVLRQKYVELKAPEAFELKMLRNEISDSIRNNAIKQDQKSFLRKLDKIKRILEEGDQN